MSPSRDSASHIQLIEKDNLSTHVSRETKLALAAWPEIRIQFIPKYACWLNLIEPWWKQLRSLALKGKRFESLDELTNTLNAAVVYWNVHRHPYRWKKVPQEQFTLLGGFNVSYNIF